MPDRGFRPGWEHDRGQSEALGFVLVFAIIVTSVVLVAATGYGGLQQVQSAERTNNAVNGFEVLADNVDELARGAPSRETELALAGAGLSFGDPGTVTVRAVRVSDGTETFSNTTQFRPLVYDPGTGTTLVYENGAVVRADREGMLMLREPDLMLSDTEAVIPVVEVRSPETRSVGGQSTVILSTVRNRSASLSSVEAATERHEVTLEITSPRADAWERHLEGEACTTLSRVDDTVTCTFETDRTYATLVQVETTFE